jgi:hypothetical protein
MDLSNSIAGADLKVLAFRKTHIGSAPIHGRHHNGVQAKRQTSTRALRSHHNAENPMSVYIANAVMASLYLDRGLN